MARLKQNIMSDMLPFQTNVQVVDGEGNDVTPVSLIPKKKLGGLVGASTGSESKVKNSHSSLVRLNACSDVV